MSKHGPDPVVRASDHDAISLQEYSTTYPKAPSSETSPSYSAVQQDDSTYPENSKLITQDRKKPALQHVLRFGWWWEIGAVIVAIISTSAIVAVLVRIDGKSIASWPYSIQPASLVAVFSSIAKSTLLVPVAVCLSQLKWSYFEKPRQLAHAQVFDDASRGPWGALVLLWKTRGTAWLAGMGALVTVLLMTFEPFSQQAIDFDEKVILLGNETGRVFYADGFSDEQFAYDDGALNYIPEVRLDFTIAMMQGMAGKPTLYASNMQCPVKDCRFEDFTSLGACTQCETELVQINNDFGCTYYTSSNTTDSAVGRQDYARSKPFVEAVRRDMGQNLSNYGMDCTQTKEGFPPLIMNFEVQASNKTFNLRGLSYLKNTTTLSETAVFGNTYYRTEGNYSVTAIRGSSFRFCTSGKTNTTDNFATIDAFTCLEAWWNPGNISSLDTFGEFKANITHCRLSMCAQEYRDVTISNNTLSTAPITSTPLQKSDEKSRIPGDVLGTATIAGVKQTFAIGPKRMSWLVDMLETSLYSPDYREFMVVVTTNQTKSDSGWPDVFERIAPVVAGFMGSPSVSWSTSVSRGLVYAPQTFFKVTWGWLVMPFAMVFASIVFLIATAMYSHRKTYLFKNSILAAMRYGVQGWELGEKNAGREMDTDLAKKAEGLRARFIRDADGDMKLVKVD